MKRPVQESWVPALGRGLSVTAYESWLRRLSLDDLPSLVLRELRCGPTASVLDLGCGPGQLSRTLLSCHRGVRVTGLDVDHRMLAQAVRQAPAEGAHWVLGTAQRLPFANATFDCVTAVLLLHHLVRGQKMLALSEARRVLRPGGELHVADWTKPCGKSALGFLLVRLLDGFEQTADHSAGRLTSLIHDAGFQDLETLRTRTHPLGTIIHLRAEKPKHHDTLETEPGSRVQAPHTK